MNIKDIFRFSFLKLLIMLLIIVSALFAIRSNINILNVYGWIILFVFPSTIFILFKVKSSVLVILFIVMIYAVNAFWVIILSALINSLLKKLFKNK